MEHQDIANKHISVLLDQLVAAIEIKTESQNVIVDATLGMAGHACEIISQLHLGDIFVGFDADTRNLPLARQRIQELSKKLWKPFHVHCDELWFQAKTDAINILLVHSNFEHLKTKLAQNNIHSITGIYYDLWISSLHIDEAERWFSFRTDGPLDMRFDITHWKTAADIVNGYLQAQLRQIFVDYWEEPGSTKIAARIVEQRKIAKILTTQRLVEVINSVNTHPKTKTRIFQALRIEVNQELETIKTSLRDAISLLEEHGNIFVISFHSLEDRITKQIFKTESKNCICSDIICSCHHTRSLKILSKKPILPSSEEIENNSRSRSAKARHAIKIT